MKSLATIFLVSLLALTTGCSLFHRHRRAPELPPARAVESEFRARWIQKRVGELTASGAAKTDAEAQATAAEEFAKQYPYIEPGTTKPGA